MLVSELGLSHHLSTGFIRASVAHLLPEEDAKLLNHHSYDAYQALEGASSGSLGDGNSLLLEGAIRQSRLLKPAIESCINRAVQEGIGLVLEGSQLLPGVLDADVLNSVLMCILDVPDREALKLRVLSPNHSRRRLTDEQLGHLDQLQDGILSLARVHQQPIVINDELAKALQEIRSLMGR